MKGNEIIALWQAADEAVRKGGAPSGGEMGDSIRGRYDVLYDGCSCSTFREKRYDLCYFADCTRVPHQWTLGRRIDFRGDRRTRVTSILVSEIDPSAEYDVAAYASEAEMFATGKIACRSFEVFDSTSRRDVQHTYRFETFAEADAFARRLAQEHIDRQRKDATGRRHTPLRVQDNVQFARERGELRHYEYYVYDEYRYFVAVSHAD